MENPERQEERIEKVELFYAEINIFIAGLRDIFMTEHWRLADDGSLLKGNLFFVRNVDSGTLTIISDFPGFMKMLTIAFYELILHSDRK